MGVVADVDHLKAKGVVREQAPGAPAAPAAAADVEVQLLLVNDQAFSHLLWSSSGNLTAADESAMKDGCCRWAGTWEACSPECRLV